MMKKMRSGGFTLVELMLVIAIIGILAAVLFALIGPQRERARVSNFKQTISSLRASYTTCNDESGTIQAGAASNTVPLCNPENNLGNIPTIQNCNGKSGEYAQISQVLNADQDAWAFRATCERTGTNNVCEAICNAGGCVFCNKGMATGGDLANHKLPTCESANRGACN